MRVADFTVKLAALTRTIADWRSSILATDRERRERIARYAEAIAATLARMGRALERLERKPTDRAAHRALLREIGRLRGHVENIGETLRGRIDGRRLAGLTRRLQRVAGDVGETRTGGPGSNGRLERLAATEGWFRALADSARAR